MKDDTTTLVDGLVFPECPRWHGGRLYVSDMRDCRVISIGLEGDVEEVVQVRGRPAGLGWSTDGELLVVSMTERRLLRLRSGRLETVADLSGLATGPCNDMTVDARGNAYIGNCGYDTYAGESPQTACLIRVSPAGELRVVAKDLVFPNGVRFTAGGRAMILAESYANRLTQFTVTEDGSLTERRVFAELGNCVPDGICLDAEGAAWVADADQPRVLRVLDGGQVAQVLYTGGLRAFACELGGVDGRQLFICTAPTIGPSNVEKRQGRVQVAQVAIPGIGT